MKHSIKKFAQNAFLTLFGGFVAGSALSQNDVTIQSMKNLGYLPDSMQTEQLSQLPEGLVLLNSSYVDNDKENFYAFKDDAPDRANYIVFGNTDTTLNLGEKSQYINVGYTDEEQEVMDSTRRFLDSFTEGSSDISTYVFQATANEGSQASVLLDGGVIRNTTVDSTKEWLTDYVTEGSSEEFTMRIHNEGLGLDTMKTMTLSDLDTLKFNAYIDTTGNGDLDPYSYTIPIAFNEGTNILGINTAKNDTILNTFFSQAGDTTIVYETDTNEVPINFIASGNAYQTRDTLFNFTPGEQDTVDLRLDSLPDINVFEVTGQVMDHDGNPIDARYIITAMNGDTIQDDSTANGTFRYEAITSQDSIERIFNITNDDFEPVADTVTLASDTVLTYVLDQSTDIDDALPDHPDGLEANVYPNPFKDKVHVDFNDPTVSRKMVTVSMYNIQGQQVYNGSHMVNNGKMNVDFTKDFTDGMYFMKIQYGAQDITKKLLNK
ncbi:MAG: T9SS type A sorting domain-containing protein [Nanobdellota archaeon]